MAAAVLDADRSEHRGAGEGDFRADSEPSGGFRIVVLGGAEIVAEDAVHAVEVEAGAAVLDEDAGRVLGKMHFEEEVRRAGFLVRIPAIGEVFAHDGERQLGVDDFRHEVVDRRIVVDLELADVFCAVDFDGRDFANGGIHRDAPVGHDEGPVPGSRDRRRNRLKRTVLTIGGWGAGADAGRRAAGAAGTSLTGAKSPADRLRDIGGCSRPRTLRARRSRNRCRR